MEVQGENIGRLASRSIEDLAGWLERLELTPFEKEVMGQALSQVRSRIHFLRGLGLGYLALAREGGDPFGG